MYIIFEECAATGMTIAKTSQLSLIFNPAFHAEILNKSLIDFFIQNSTDWGLLFETCAGSVRGPQTNI